ncbi:MAG: SDR family oxidoreductase [Proteobacteria bacterium]|nr:SDR family oxidoreductase [Pseudomonadota bacterium]
MKLFEIPGQVAVVTGAAHGIGLATARLLAEAGASVALLDLDEAAARSAAADIGPRAAAWACDVTSEARVETVFAEIGARFGRLDVLVNSAGAAVRKPATEISMEEWERVLDLNLGATFLCSRVAARAMQKQGGGAIVNLASIMGFSGGIFPNASYQASKGGVVNLTRALALEWAEQKIRVNAVAPTFVKTGLTVPIFTNPEVLARVMAHTPLGVLPEPGDIAAAILYLASPAARCITGITLPVDSGYLAR